MKISIQGYDNRTLFACPSEYLLVACPGQLNLASMRAVIPELT